MRTLNDYFNDELSPQEEERMTRQLFQERFNSDAVSRKRRWAKILTEDFDLKRKKKRAVSEGSPRRFLYIAILAAASIALLMLVMLPQNHELSYDDQLQAYMTDFHYEGNNRKSLVPGAETEEASARAAYNERRFKEAEILWANLAQTRPDVAEYRFFQAMSIFYQPEPNYSKVIAILTGILPESERLGEEARWYLALALLQVDRKEAAQEQLRYIVERQDWKQEAAASLLQYFE